MDRRPRILRWRGPLLLAGGRLEIPELNDVQPGDAVLLVRVDPEHPDRVHPLATVAERAPGDAPTVIGRHRYRLELPIDAEAAHLSLDARRDLPELGIQPASDELRRMVDALGATPGAIDLAAQVLAISDRIAPDAWWELEDHEHPRALDLALRRLLAAPLLEACGHDEALRALAEANLEPGDTLQAQTFEVGPGLWCLAEPHRLAAIGRDSTPPDRLAPNEIEVMTESGLLVGARVSRRTRARVGPPLGRAAAATCSTVTEFHLRLERGRLALLMGDIAPSYGDHAWVSVPTGEYIARLLRPGPVGRRLVGAELVLELAPAARRGIRHTALPVVE